MLTYIYDLFSYRYNTKVQMDFHLPIQTLLSTLPSHSVISSTVQGDYITVITDKDIHLKIRALCKKHGFMYTTHNESNRYIYIINTCTPRSYDIFCKNNGNNLQERYIGIFKSKNMILKHDEEIGEIEPGCLNLRLVDSESSTKMPLSIMKDNLEMMKYFKDSVSIAVSDPIISHAPGSNIIAQIRIHNSQLYVQLNESAQYIATELYRKNPNASIVIEIDGAIYGYTPISHFMKQHIVIECNSEERARELHKILLFPVSNVKAIETTERNNSILNKVMILLFVIALLMYLYRKRRVKSFMMIGILIGLSIKFKLSLFVLLTLIIAVIADIVFESYFNVIYIMGSLLFLIIYGVALELHVLPIYHLLYSIIMLGDRIAIRSN